MKNYREATEKFVAKLEERANSLEAKSANYQDWKKTASYLQNQQRGFNATCKVLRQYMEDATAEEKNSKKSFYRKFSLIEIEGLDAMSVKAFIVENLPRRVDEKNRILSAVKCSELLEARKAAKEATELCNDYKGSKSAPQSIKDEMKGIETRLKKYDIQGLESLVERAATAKARKEYEEKLEEAKKEVEELTATRDELKKDWGRVLEERAAAARKEADELAQALYDAVEEAGYQAWTDAAGQFIGAYAPVVQWTPKALADTVRAAAVAKNTAATSAKTAA